jgi:hypothetical protein
MKTPHVRLFRPILIGVVVVSASCPALLHAQAKKNPASKLYISDVAGEAQIDTGDAIEDLNKRSVYSAQGTVIETKPVSQEKDRAKAYSTMVYSNGTGAFFDADTRVEIRKFVQEPFVPTRADMEVEPSISQTQAFISRGTVGLCTSKLVAGSSMSYATPHGSVSIQGRKVVIQAEANQTKISMLEGDGTVKAGTMDMGGHTLHAGQQAIIRPGAPGQPNSIDIIAIPHAEASQLDDKVAMACMAKRTVYFEVRGRQTNSGNGTGEGANAAGQVNAFDGNTTPTRSAGSPITMANGEIVAIPVVPVNLPVQFTVSPATITTPSGNVIRPGQGGPPGG